MKHILLIAFIFCFVSLSAQSLIVTTEGNPITGYEVEVTSSGVFYKSENNADSPFIKLDKKNVLMIRHADGGVVNLSETAASNTASTTQNSAVVNEYSTQKEMNPDDYLDHEYNATVIAKYNTPAKVTFLKESDKKKEINSVILQHYTTKDSQFASKDLIVSYNIIQNNVIRENGGKSLKWIDGLRYNFLPRVYIQLENRSNKSIFIDLANTFLIRNEESTPYYIPGATSSTSGGSVGASINLGAVVGGGGGGAVGSLAKGVNVGSTTSKYTTNITYAQRIIVIPPKSTYKLDGKDIIASKEFRYKYFRYEISHRRMLLFKEYYPEKIGESLEWEESNALYKICSFLTYSFSEDFVETYTLKSTLYTKRVIGSNAVYHNGKLIPNCTVKMEGSSIVF